MPETLTAFPDLATPRAALKSANHPGSTTTAATVRPGDSGANWYAYVNNDPVSYVDLWGLDARDSQPTKPAQMPPSGLTREEMAAWNQANQYTSKSWLPGSQVTGNFLEPAYRLQLLNSKYLTYVHTGIDRTGASKVVSPGYYEVVKVEDANSVTLQRVGTDVQNTLVHLADTSTLAAGQLLYPGDEIGATSAAGNSTGVHLHNEESTVVNGTRVFENPDTHVPVSSDVQFPWITERAVPKSSHDVTMEGLTYTTLTSVANVLPK